ncbi:Hypothetical predicted protein [Lynx pardinus]|uniref:Uncharacterized protein n=1 Tax=Lynx pardinus TaxID=191816 RepID=A0A485NC07_LYNPA|nr:Hypothetical predicted protein [Lynx pardinus]
MAALRPPVKPKMVKKRTKKFFWKQTIDKSKLSATGGNLEALTIWSSQKIHGPDPDAHRWLWEQQESKAHAAQWLPEVPSPQHQGA